MGRWFLVAVVLCLIAPAAAQGLDVVDPAGDEAASTPAGMVGTGGQYPHADLLGYSIGPDTPDAFPILIQLAQWQNQFGYEPDGEGRIVALHFRYADFSYRVIASSTCAGGFGLQSSVDARPGTVGGWTGRACLDGTVDAAGLATIIVPKQALANATGEPIFAGARLTETFAHVRDTTSTGASFAAPTLIDRAPDTGFGPELVFQYGLQNDGLLGLTADVPVRWSNGEPSTFVYDVTLHNRGGAGAFIVSSTHVPEGWRVVHPQLVHLEAEATLRIPVVLTTQSNHAHGGTAFFTLMAHATQGGSNASIPLGIHYPAIAQPAGHHPALHFHSAEGAVGSRPVPWMNTQSKDPSGSQNPPVKHMGAQYDPSRGQTYVQWGLAMNPPLRMGLDFRTEESVQVHLEFETDAPTMAEAAYVRLLYCDPLLEGRSQLAACPGADVVLAAGSGPMTSLGVGESVALELELPLVGAADRLPFQEGSQLGVHVQVNVTGAAPFVGLSMRMDPAEVWLPLNEYRDDVPLELSRGELLLSVDRSERRASPGTTVVAGVEIRNEGSVEAEILLLAEGVQRDWAQFSQETLIVKPSDVKQVQVAIRVPEDAVVGQVHEFLVIAQSAHGASSVAPLRVDVVAEATEDEAHLFQTPSKKTPWLGFFALPVLLLSAALRRSA